MVQGWRPLAKDGASLPANQAVPRPAFVIMGAGETLDVELLRQRAESLTPGMVKPKPAFFNRAGLRVLHSESSSR